jgi:formamidopyrimidine-DNA glycosylase
MPELPEVETIRRGLVNQVCNKRIERVEVRCKRIVVRPSIPELAAALTGQSIRDIQRRGKFLLFELESYKLLVHLGMSGQITYWDKTRRNDDRFLVTMTGLQKARQHATDKHTHVSVYFNDGNAMHYRDIRQFGRWRLYRHQEFNQAREYLRLGMEPFTDEYQLAKFQEQLRKRKVKIKSLLLNQTIVAGVGNIYADEALFEAKIRPERIARALSTQEQRLLFKAIPRVLRRGLQNGGTTFRNYQNSAGEEGHNQERLKVYGRYGEKCRKCRAQIMRVVVNQRSSHFCPRCQH